MARGANSNDTIQPTKPSPCQIENEDFQAHFDGAKWTVEWRWTTELPELMNQIGCYESTLREEIRAEFRKEVKKWMEEGILIPRKVGGILLFPAVIQPTKKKVRPVLDFQDLNKYVACRTRNGIDVCKEVMRKWKRMERATKIMAYLQIHVAKKL